MRLFGSRRFFRKGVRFECQGCGKCCLSRGEFGYVYLTAGDRQRISAHLGLTTLEFTRTFTARTDGLLHLRDPDENCLFLENNRCKIYEVRPRQCRAWPFWSENMTRASWETDVMPRCPGVGKGRLYGIEDIEAILRLENDPLG